MFDPHQAPVSQGIALAKVGWILDRPFSPEATCMLQVKGSCCIINGVCKGGQLCLILLLADVEILSKIIIPIL